MEVIFRRGLQGLRARACSAGVLVLEAHTCTDYVVAEFERNGGGEDSLGNLSRAAYAPECKTDDNQ